ncbi:cell separation during budding [Irineochytrium annulatum]|nr:cell separation during budding [Irineochytrium annulatum]
MDPAYELPPTPPSIMRRSSVTSPTSPARTPLDKPGQMAALDKSGQMALDEKPIHLDAAITSERDKTDNSNAVTEDANADYSNDANDMETAANTAANINLSANTGVPSVFKANNLNNVNALLSSTRVGDLLNAPAKPPICLDAELSVQEGCAALAEHRISSAPVYSRELGGFLGMLDYRDLVAYVLKVFHKVRGEEDGFNADAEMEVSDIVVRATMDRQGVPVKLVTNLSHRDPLLTVYSDAPVIDAVELFCRSNVHRIVVLERPDPSTTTSADPQAPASTITDPSTTTLKPAPPKFLGVISQSSVAQLLADRFGKLTRARCPPQEINPPWHLGDRSLRDLGLVRGRVISVSGSDTVLDALHVMHDNAISSVAIVDSAAAPGSVASPGGSSPRLLGSIGMTDVKEVLSSRGGWRRLYEPAFRFFASVRSRQGIESGGNDRVPSFSVQPSCSLIAAIERMAATRAHRVWIVGDEGELEGVLSLSDVMPLLLPGRA